MTATSRVNGLIGTLGIKAPVRAATTANIVLSGLQTVDGVVLAADDRVLVKDQTDPVENGIYYVETGAWSRAPDFDGARDVVTGTEVNVNEGTVNAVSKWRVATTGSILPGSTALTFTVTIDSPAAAIHAATLEADPSITDEIGVWHAATGLLRKITFTFLQFGTGAVLRRIRDKLSETISVKDFGAVGDGVTDDTAAISAAITAAAGKSLIFPSATYKFSTPLYISNINVDFQGSSLYYTGPAGVFALTLESNAGGGTTQTCGNSFGNFTLYQSDFSASVVLVAAPTWDPPSVAGGAAISNITPGGASTTFNVPGALEGGFVRASSPSLTDGMALTAWVSAPGVVTAWLSNYGLSAVDLGLITVNLQVYNTAYNGLSIGGPLGTLKNAKVQGFTGLSLMVGGGTGNNARDPVSGIVSSALSRAYYWDVDANIAAAAGWSCTIPPRSNENTFSIGTFPFDAYGDPVPKRAPTISQLVLSGIGNKFARLSLESSSSEETILIYYGSNQNSSSGNVYIETNSNYATPPFPRVKALPTTSGNSFKLRHPYVTGAAVSDFGVANHISAAPSYFVNGAQEAPAGKGVNLVANGDFTNGLTKWNDFGAGCVTTITGTGRISGKRLRADLIAGRINITQDLIAANGFTSSGLVDLNVTVCGWIKTDTPYVVLRLDGFSNAAVPGDGVERFFSTTSRSALATCTLSIYSATNATGYVEVSNVTAYVGNETGTVNAPTLLGGSAAYNPPSIAPAGQAQTTVTVTGAALGDFAEASFGLDLQGVELSAYVSAADTVTCLFKNGTAGAVDLANSTLRCVVRRAA